MSWLVAALLFVPQTQAPTAAPRPFTDRPEQDAIEYALRLRVDLEHETLTGTVDYTFAAVTPLRTITLDARHGDAWQVAFATTDGAELPAAWQDDHVTLTLPKPLAVGERTHFRAVLAGHPLDGFYFAKNRYGEAMAFTDHYSVRARGWLPCEDHPADRAHFSAHVEYQKGNEVVGTGKQVTPAGGTPAPADGFVAVDLDEPAELPPYMFALVIGPFARVHEDGDARLLDHFVYRRDAARARLGLVHDADWLHLMEKAFGTYPFAKYTTAQCPTRWGGFEAPGNVLLMESLFDGPDHGSSTLAHELVHMWFGDGIGYADWRDVWLSEGFASYFGPWLLSRTGGPSLATALADMRQSWAGTIEGRSKSIRDDHYTTPDEILNANTYPKAAWVLHMLRGELGDEAFFAALRAHWQAHVGKAITTADFVRVVERSSGQQLGWFFDQWLDRVGCPELRVSTTDAAIVVEQMQKGEPYRCWLRLRWQDAAGKPQEQRVRLEGARTEVPAAGGAQHLVIDPQVELLFRKAG